MGCDRAKLELSVRRDLPVRARWMLHGTPLDFDFSASNGGLGDLPAEAAAHGDVAVSDLEAFGQQDYAQGGGAGAWLCVRGRDGAVCGYDPEHDQPVFLLNSSLDQFITTFRLLNRRLGSAPEPLPDIESLARAIDPDAYPTSEWRRLLESLRDG